MEPKGPLVALKVHYVSKPKFDNLSLQKMRNTDRQNLNPYDEGSILQAKLGNVKWEAINVVARAPTTNTASRARTTPKPKLFNIKKTTFKASDSASDPIPNDILKVV